MAIWRECGEGFNVDAAAAGGAAVHRAAAFEVFR